MTTLQISRRFCGPPRSANGGYTAGSLAEALGTDTTEVTLRMPPPLESTMDVEVDGARASLTHGRAPVATATASEVVIDPVEPVSYDDAAAFSAAYPGHSFHPFPTCFACGVDRDDGLRIFPGPVSEDERPRARVAAPWCPADDVDLATTWAALDCVGGWAGDLTERLMVLGRMTATVDVLPRPGEPHVVMGRALGSKGRKTMTSATLYDGDGRIVGRAAHVWIAVDPAAFHGQTPR
ncbi:hypothetical protein [Nocardioides terrisoli]|uniref:hypothetical protein n=1 Tax=Nocardioides terrisoli TaxID=3388267 RepID=UPI00287B7B0F|nr:hypothetical protein [Nocardioides marmorisolisilvae]